jgi:hypothetical protein
MVRYVRPQVFRLLSAVGVVVLAPRIPLFVFALLTSGLNAHAQSAPASAAAGSDPLMGTWVLNVSKSTFEGVPAPKSERRFLDFHGDMLLNVTETVNASESRSVSHYIAAFDDKPYPEYSRQGGPKPIATLWFTRPDRYSIKVRGTNDVPNGDFTGTWIISPDGKTLTIHLLGKNRTGQSTNRIRVYERE